MPIFEARIGLKSINIDKKMEMAPYIIKRGHTTNHKMVFYPKSSLHGRSDLVEDKARALCPLKCPSFDLANRSLENGEGHDEKHNC